MNHPRKIIVHIAASADGYTARPDGDVAWLDRPRPPQASARKSTTTFFPATRASQPSRPSDS